MNFKHLSIILLLILVLFSISAVSATNETSAGNATVESDNTTNIIVADNTTIASNVSGDSYSGNIGYANASSSSGIDLPFLQVALVSDEESPFNQYIDISVGNEENSVNINNKNYFFSLTPQVNGNTPGNNNLIDVILFNRNNSYAFNISMLNKAHQEANLTAPNFFWDFINKLISAFFSLFN